VRVDYVLDGGLAFHGVDFTASGGTLIFPAGETTREILVTLLDDDLCRNRGIPDTATYSRHGPHGCRNCPSIH
jgi:hypothetical protein